MRKLIACLVAVAISLQLSAQADDAPQPRKLLMINPAETGRGIEMVHGGHLALYYPSVRKVHKLFVMIVGTGGNAVDMITIDSALAAMGYHTLSLDYRNNVITTTCNNSPDSACFDKFRQEIMFGTPVSDSVNVDTANSIINRLKTALQYLVKNDPDGGWDEYIAGNRIQWNNIVIAGHSQGAGHAAYIGKRFNVSKVLMFSGPQDYRVAFGSPAAWLSGRSATPKNRFYAFLHIKDQYDVTRQLANCAKVMGAAKPDSITVQPGVALYTEKHILVNNITTDNPHMSTLLPVFRNVWAYMLKDPD